MLDRLEKGESPRTFSMVVDIRREDLDGVSKFAGPTLPDLLMC